MEPAGPPATVLAAPEAPPPIPAELLAPPPRRPGFAAVVAAPPPASAPEADTNQPARPVSRGFEVVIANAAPSPSLTPQAHRDQCAASRGALVGGGTYGFCVLN